MHEFPLQAMRKLLCWDETFEVTIFLQMSDDNDRTLVACNKVFWFHHRNKRAVYGYYQSTTLHTA